MTFLASPDFGCRLLVDRIRLKERFRANKTGGIRGGVRAVHIAAALAGYRTTLVCPSWSFSHLVSTNEHRNHSFPLVHKGTIFGSVGGFQSGRRVFTGQRTLTIKSLLMSGCG